MQAEIALSENNIETKKMDHPITFQNARPIQGVQESIEGSGWDDSLPQYEKYINRVCWVAIIASVIYLTPICVNILMR